MGVRHDARSRKVPDRMSNRILISFGQRLLLGCLEYVTAVTGAFSANVMLSRWQIVCL